MNAFVKMVAAGGCWMVAAGTAFAGEQVGRSVTLPPPVSADAGARDEKVAISRASFGILTS
jgi:hypothetical protein